MKRLLPLAVATGFLLAGCGGGASPGDASACTTALNAIDDFELVSFYGDDTTRFSLQLADQLTTAARRADNEDLKAALQQTAELQELRAMAGGSLAGQLVGNNIEDICTEDLGLDCELAGMNYFCRS
jgi:hypothetical protein